MKWGFWSQNRVLVLTQQNPISGTPQSNSAFLQQVCPATSHTTWLNGHLGSTSQSASRSRQLLPCLHIKVLLLFFLPAHLDAPLLHAGLRF